jgi:manganese/iron transport system substrate-binding protein
VNRLLLGSFPLTPLGGMGERSELEKENLMIACKPSLVVLFLAPLFLLAACESRPSQTQSAAPQKIGVVTTMTVLGDMIQQVGGEKVEVQALVPPGGDVHTYQPTPEDIKRVSQSRIVFYNGVHLEDWLDGTIRSASKPDLPIVVLAEGLPIIQESGEEPNPHLWLDIANAKIYVEKIRDGLSKIDSGNAGYYADRAKNYLGQLDELDKWIQAEVETIPKARRKLVTFHDAFPYFAKRYGFDLVGFVVESPGKEPSARETTALVRRIKRERVPAIFAESQFSPKLMDVLAKDAGVRVITSLYDDSLSSGPEANTYITMMKYDTTQVVNALK